MLLYVKKSSARSGTINMQHVLQRAFYPIECTGAMAVLIEMYIFGRTFTYEPCRISNRIPFRNFCEMSYTFSHRHENATMRSYILYQTRRACRWRQIQRVSLQAPLPGPRSVSDAAPGRGLSDNISPNFSSEMTKFIDFLLE